MVDKEKTGKSPATEVAKKQAESKPTDGIITLSTGVKARIVPVSPSLITDAMQMISDPEIPVQMVDEKGRKEPNPLDPQYLKEVEEADRKRGIASTDVMVLFGVELVDPIPPDEEWLPKLKFLEKRGQLKMSEYDFSDKIEREFAYKRFIAIANIDLMLISQASGIDQEEVNQAMRGFLSPTLPDTD